MPFFSLRTRATTSPLEGPRGWDHVLQSRNVYGDDADDTKQRLTIIGLVCGTIIVVILCGIMIFLIIRRRLPRSRPSTSPMRYAYTRTGTSDVETEANTYKEVPGWISSGYRYDPHLGAFGLPSRLAHGATYSSTVFRDQLQLNTSPGLLEVSQQTSLMQSATSPPPYQRGYPRQSDVLLGQPARPHAELHVDNAAEGSFSRIRNHGQYVLPTAPSWATVWLTNNRQTRRDRVPSFRDEDIGDDLDRSFSSEDYEGAKPPMNDNCESQDTLGAGFTERTPGLSKLTTHSYSFTIPTLAPAPRHSFTVPEEAQFLPQPISQSPPPIHAVHAVPQAVSFGPDQSGLGRSTSENLRTTTIIRPLPVLPSRDLPAP